jgi:hypothetical protein
MAIVATNLPQTREGMLLFKLASFCAAGRDADLHYLAVSECQQCGIPLDAVGAVETLARQAFDSVSLFRISPLADSVNSYSILACKCDELAHQVRDLPYARALREEEDFRERERERDKRIEGLYRIVTSPQLYVILMLLWALYPGNPYGYYILLRIVCCPVFAFRAYRSYEARKTGWSWVLGVLAAIYNPFVLVHLTREIWTVINIASIAVAVMTNTRRKTIQR